MQNGADFIIIGAAKSGTTVVQKWLQRQRQVFMTPVKEPHFFCFEGLDASSIGVGVDAAYARQMAFSEDAYSRMFDAAQPGQIRGEASPGYLYFPRAARRIARANPDTKIICLLRDPAQRAYSQYMHHVRDGYETYADFADALDAERERIKAGYWWGYHYRNAGFYAPGLRRFLENFHARQVLPLLYDDLNRDPAGTFDTICDFLGVDPDVRLDFRKRTNVASGMGRIARFSGHANLAHERPRLGRMMAKVGLSPHGKICGRAAPPLDPELRNDLSQTFAQDILVTSKLIGRDLSHWLH